MLTGLTTLDSIKKFWPGIVNELSEDDLDTQINFYISRAEILLNRAADLNLSVSGAQASLNIAANLLVRRLVYWDNHPASTAEPANVGRESTSGLSYSIGKFRTLQEILGEEIGLILSSLFPEADLSVAMTTQEVFHAPIASYINSDGQSIKTYVPELDGDEGWRVRYPGYYRYRYGRSV